MKLKNDDYLVVVYNWIKDIVTQRKQRIQFEEAQAEDAKSRAKLEIVGGGLWSYAGKEGVFKLLESRDGSRDTKISGDWQGLITTNKIFRFITKNWCGYEFSKGDEEYYEFLNDCKEIIEFRWR